MRITSRITVTLGPAECVGCGLYVVYGTARIRGMGGKLRRWRDPATGKQHKCGREAE